MSENSELIHWHLQPRSVALFGGAEREEGPVVAHSVLPHPQQQLGCHLPLEGSRLGGGGTRFNMLALFYWFNLYLSRFVPAEI